MPDRARSGPFGTTIAHGFLTLSLIPHFLETALRVEGLRMVVNYGLNKVRFTAPVPVGSRIRAHLHLMAVQTLRTRRPAIELADHDGAGRRLQTGLRGRGAGALLQLSV